MLSIIIPTHNEEKRIEGTLLELISFLKKNKVKSELIISDDSRDNTLEIVKRIVGREGVACKMLHFKKRMGKGKAVTLAMKKAHWNALLYDADGSTPSNQIPKLLNALKECDVAIGSRSLPASAVKGVSLQRRIASKVFNFLVNLLFSLGIRDTQCGFKLIKKSAVKKLVPLLKTRGFEWDVELLWKAKRLGFRVCEIPIKWQFKGEGTIKGIPVKTGLQMIAGLVRIRLGK